MIKRFSDLWRKIKRTWSVFDIFFEKICYFFKKIGIQIYMMTIESLMFLSVFIALK